METITFDDIATLVALVATIDPLDEEAKWSLAAKAMIFRCQNLMDKANQSSDGQVPVRIVR
jgi:hypothetical protein